MKNKIFKLKNWYNLEDAAKRLSITIGEEFTLKDVIHFIIDGQIKLSWILQSKHMRWVAFCSYVLGFYNKDAPDNTWMTQEELDYYSEIIMKPAKIRTIYGVMPQSQTYQINGIYYLDINLNGVIKHWLLSLVTKDKTKLYQLGGFFVYDNNGNIWQIMKRNEEDITTRLKNNNLYASSLAPYIPDEDYPELMELVIRKKDLESFEDKFSNEENSDKKIDKIDKREKTSLIKIISGLLACNYGAEEIKGNQVKVSELLEDLSEKGITIDDDTLRKYLREATQYLLKNSTE